MTLSLGWFSTGRGPGSRGLFRFVQNAITSGDLDASMDFVFCNRESEEAQGSDKFIALVQRHQVPLVTLSSRRFRREHRGDAASSRLAFDHQAMDLIKEFRPDICILAGYMLIVGPEMCRQYTMLNLHPALPDGPTGAWQDVIWTLIETQARETGAMIHLAVDEVDRGPVVSYFTLPLQTPAYSPEWSAIQGRSLRELRDAPGEKLPLFKRIREDEYRREPHLLAQTLKALVRGAIVIRDHQVFDGKGLNLEGLCLNQPIEDALRTEAS